MAFCKVSAPSQYENCRYGPPTLYDSSFLTNTYLQYNSSDAGFLNCFSLINLNKKNILNSYAIIS